MERQKQIKECPKEYREKMKAEKTEKMKKEKTYQEKYSWEVVPSSCSTGGPKL
jgi:hypothetical protein